MSSKGQRHAGFVIGSKQHEFKVDKNNSDMFE